MVFAQYNIKNIICMNESMTSQKVINSSGITMLTLQRDFFQLSILKLTISWSSSTYTRK